MRIEDQPLEAISKALASGNINDDIIRMALFESIAVSLKRLADQNEIQRKMAGPEFVKGEDCQMFECMMKYGCGNPAKCEYKGGCYSIWPDKDALDR